MDGMYGLVCQLAIHLSHTVSNSLSLSGNRSKKRVMCR